MDTRSRIEQAGYRIEGDAAVIDLGPGVELKANGLTAFTESCESQNLDAVHVLTQVFENIRSQPTVQSALEAPPGNPRKSSSPGKRPTWKKSGRNWKEGAPSSSKGKRLCNRRNSNWQTSKAAVP